MQTLIGDDYRHCVCI